MIEKIKFREQILAIIIYSQFDKPGIHFFTPENFPQQFGYMKRPAGHKVAPHTHNVIQREIFQIQETLFIRKGKIKVTFYDPDHYSIESRILGTGDAILLAAGGHGIEMLEETEIIEVKQGPYVGDNDKIKFEGKNRKYETDTCQ